LKNALIFIFLLSCTSIPKGANLEPTPDINKLWNFSSPKTSRDTFLKTIETHSSKPLYVLELQTQIARTYGLESNFEKSHEVLDKIENQLEKSDSVVKARYHLERGRTYNSAGLKKEARSEFQKAYNVALAVKNDYLTIDAAHMIAIVEQDFEQQKKWTFIAINLAKKTEDKSAQKWEGSLLNNWGWSLFEKEHYEDALQAFMGAEEFYSQFGSQSQQLIAKWTVARCLRALKKYNQAISIQKNLESTWEKLGTTDPYVYEELGELYNETKQSVESKKYFKLAFEGLSKDSWFVKNEKVRLERIKKLSN
jgi:Tfp pilus assembly protein PilF